MRKVILIGAMTISALVPLHPAHAHAQHHHHHHYHQVARMSKRRNHGDDAVSVSNMVARAGGLVNSGGNALVNLAMRDLGRNPTGWAHQWCAHYLGMVLHEAGLPAANNTAISYAHYGKPTTPHAGAIAVMSHHVGIVKDVVPGGVILVSGNHGHKVGVGRYSLSRIVAFRDPV